MSPEIKVLSKALSEQRFEVDKQVKGFTLLGPL
jgi:hypothetical protein